MKYTYKFREIQNCLVEQGLKMVIYKEGKYRCYFVIKNEVVLSRHILLSSIIRTYNLDKNLCIDVSDS